MLGTKIKALRQERRLTQAQLSSILNVTRSAVALWETDKTDPDIKNIIAIAKIFSISTDYLFGLEDESGRKIYSIHDNIINNHGNISFK